MAFRVGDKVGGYRFLRVLNAAGSAMVYEVENEVAGRCEILKLLPGGFDQDRDRVDRFLREAKIHSRLSHPNIAEFYSGFQLDGQLVMTMEKVEGVSLGSRIAAGELSIAETLDVARQTLSALDYAHERQVVHREITPANIVIRADGVVKLTGLGLAKQEHDPALTQVGTVIGQVHYMSPEQVKGQRDIDGRADIYALGVVLYEAATGKKPFDSQSQFDIIQAQVMQDPTPPAEVNPSVGDELGAVILKALAKDREERYQTAGAFRTALDSLSSAVDPPAAGPQADMQNLAQNLEFERGPVPEPAPVLQAVDSAPGGGDKKAVLKRMPAWTEAGAVVDDPTARQ